MLRSLTRDTSGVALVEFAIVLPVLIMLFFGGYQLSDAIACKRRVTIMARAIGDLTTQYRTMTEGELQTVMAASTQIMAPYSATPAAVRVTHLTVNSTGTLITVNWSRGRNTGGYPNGLYYATAIPAPFRQPNMTFVLTETTYNYNSVLSEYVKSMQFSQSIWLLPRRSSAIALTT